MRERERNKRCSTTRLNLAECFDRMQYNQLRNSINPLHLPTKLKFRISSNSKEENLSNSHVDFSSRKKYMFIYITLPVHWSWVPNSKTNPSFAFFFAAGAGPPVCLFFFSAYCPCSPPPPPPLPLLLLPQDQKLLSSWSFKPATPKFSFFLFLPSTPE